MKANLRCLLRRPRVCLHCQKRTRAPISVPWPVLGFTYHICHLKEKNISLPLCVCAFSLSFFFSKYKWCHICTVLWLAFSTCSFKVQVKCYHLGPRTSQSVPSENPQLLMRYHGVQEQAEAQKGQTTISPARRPASWAWGPLCAALTRLAHPAC